MSHTLVDIINNLGHSIIILNFNYFLFELDPFF